MFIFDNNDCSFVIQMKHKKKHTVSSIGKINLVRTLLINLGINLLDCMNNTIQK